MYYTWTICLRIFLIGFFSNLSKKGKKEEKKIGFFSTRKIVLSFIHRTATAYYCHSLMDYKFICLVRSFSSTLSKMILRQLASQKMMPCWPRFWCFHSCKYPLVLNNFTWLIEESHDSLQVDSLRYEMQRMVPYRSVTVITRSRSG